jgi:hypothetical protein
MARSIPSVEDILNPNSKFSKSARAYKDAYESELAAALARGLTGEAAVFEAQYRATVVAPRQQHERRGRVGGLLFLAASGAAIAWVYQSGELTSAFVPSVTAVSVLFVLFFIAQGENLPPVR